MYHGITFGTHSHGYSSTITAQRLLLIKALHWCQDTKVAWLKGGGGGGGGTVHDRAQVVRKVV